MRTFLFVLVILFHINCGNRMYNYSNLVLDGLYIQEPIKLVKGKKIGGVVGITQQIQINSDSTFIFRTNFIQSNGKWSFNNGILTFNSEPPPLISITNIHEFSQSNIHFDTIELIIKPIEYFRSYIIYLQEQKSKQVIQFNDTMQINRLLVKKGDYKIIIKPKFKITSDEYIQPQESEVIFLKGANKYHLSINLNDGRETFGSENQLPFFAKTYLKQFQLQLIYKNKLLCLVSESSQYCK